MAIDGRRPRGSYRCGCGVRVQVAEGPIHKRRICWWSDCRLLATTQAPLDLCQEHEAAVADRLVSRAAKVNPSHWHQAATRVGEDWYKPIPEYRQVKESPAAWVYFMRRERLIKIGTTYHLKQRAQTLNAAVLAKMPGSYAEEARLHNQFKALRRVGEWFEPGPELLDFVNDLRRKEGIPPLKE